MDTIQSTLSELQRQAEQHSACLVAYSGGKDSVITLDLCSRSFKRVVCFFMFLVPELEVIEAQMEWARKRYGVEVLYYPGRLFFEAISSGRFCHNSMHYDALAGTGVKEIYEWVRHDTGIPLIATGMKKSDSMARRRFFANTAGWENITHPIQEWSKFDVMAYVEARKLQIPKMFEGHTTGVGLVSRSLLWLHDTHPADFAKMEAWFPFVRSVVYRRKYHGIE